MPLPRVRILRSCVALLVGVIACVWVWKYTSDEHPSVSADLAGRAVEQVLRYRMYDGEAWPTIRPTLDDLARQQQRRISYGLGQPAGKVVPLLPDRLDVLVYRDREISIERVRRRLEATRNLLILALALPADSPKLLETALATKATVRRNGSVVAVWETIREQDTARFPPMQQVVRTTSDHGNELVLSIRTAVGTTTLGVCGIQRDTNRKERRRLEITLNPIGRHDLSELRTEFTEHRDKRWVGVILDDVVCGWAPLAELDGEKVYFETGMSDAEIQDLEAIVMAGAFSWPLIRTDVVVRGAPDGVNRGDGTEAHNVGETESSEDD